MEDECCVNNTFQQINNEFLATPTNHYHYESLNSTLSEYSSEQQFLWQKPILIQGKAGCGKTETLMCCIKEHVRTGKNILVAAPTGLLASRFRSRVPVNVICDTVHAAFNVPIDVEEVPTTNWAISYYDIVIIDEISQISEKIFAHIMDTFNRLVYRPVLILGGDNSQQQPFEKKDGIIVNVPSPLSNSQFVSSTYHFILHGQHRVGDVEYLQFLDHIRNWRPNQEILNNIQHNRVIFPHGNITPTEFMNSFIENMDSTILTFTNSAADYLNNLVVTSLFCNENALGYFHLDNMDEAFPIYKGMKVIISQNCNKEANVVNGQMAYVETCQNHTIFLKMPNNIIVPVYQVTSEVNGQQKVSFPFRVGYAITISKSQGQTLSKCTIWFDKDIIPPGTGYVALSRVRKLSDVLFVTPLKPSFFTPVVCS